MRSRHSCRAAKDIFLQQGGWWMCSWKGLLNFQTLWKCDYTAMAADKEAVVLQALRRQCSRRAAQGFADDHRRRCRQSGRNPEPQQAVGEPLQGEPTIDAEMQLSCRRPLERGSRSTPAVCTGMSMKRARHLSPQTETLIL